MSTVIESLEQRVLQKRPNFGAGDRVRVHFQVVEGSRKRTQVFEGIVIKRQGSGARETFTVRKHSFGVGVERTFPLHSPKIEQLEVAARGDVKRAKLYYLRDKVGRRARVAERRWGIADEVVIAEPEAEAVDAEGVAVSEAEAEVTDPEPAEGEEQPADGEGSDATAEAGAEAPQGEEQPADGEQEEAEPPPAAEGADEGAPEDADPAPEGDEKASSEKAEG
jgi:large subunit ribosomal protein L19